MAESTAPATTSAKAKPTTETSTPSAPAAAPEAKRSPGKIIRKAPPGSRRAKGAKAEKRTGPFVKYVGEASHRSISDSDWASIAGMKPKSEDGYATAVWNVSNDKMIECEAFSDEQLDYLLLDDLQPSGAHSFLELDYDEEGNLVQVVDEADEEAGE